MLYSWSTYTSKYCFNCSATAQF